MWFPAGLFTTGRCKRFTRLPGGTFPGQQSILLANAKNVGRFLPDIAIINIATICRFEFLPYQVVFPKMSGFVPMSLLSQFKDLRGSLVDVAMGGNLADQKTKVLFQKHLSNPCYDS